ncbi:MAG: T9SS type A sorting domain-containing protein [Bacteroidetes bacterium]|nr:T9SS type A sorting domain-containing protein [Bacteroidota bacterium]
MKNLTLLVILLLSGVTLCAQDMQRILGTYETERTCVPETDPIECYVIVKEGTESDLLINVSITDFYFNAFVSNDSLFIPLQGGGMIWEDRVFLQGKGKIEGDSLFLQLTIRVGTFDIICDYSGKKTSSVSVATPLQSDNKVYFDATNQLIVLDETLQHQSLTLELIDMQGKEVLKKTNMNDSPISVANLPNGVYLYRLLQNGQAIYSGKILKTNN